MREGLESSVWKVKSPLWTWGKTDLTETSSIDHRCLRMDILSHLDALFRSRFQSFRLGYRGPKEARMHKGFPKATQAPKSSVSELRAKSTCSSSSKVTASSSAASSLSKQRSPGWQDLSSRLREDVRTFPCHVCKRKLAILRCGECNQHYCPMCFGRAHADPRKSRHTVEAIFDQASLDKDCLGDNNSWLDEAEDGGISGQKSKDQSSSNQTEYLFPEDGGNLLKGEYDENGAREDFAQALKEFREASKSNEQRHYSNLVFTWDPEVSRFPSDAGFKTVEKLSEPCDRCSSFAQQTDTVSSRPIEEKVNAVLWTTGDATIENTRERLAQFLWETRGKFPSNTGPTLPEEAAHVELPPEAHRDTQVSLSAPVSGASDSDVDIKRDQPKSSSSAQGGEGASEEQQRRNVSQLLKFSGVRTKAETRRLNGTTTKPNSGITVTPVTRPSSANVTTPRPTTSSRPLLGSHKKEPLSQLPPQSTRKDIKQTSVTPRSNSPSVGPRQRVTNSSERMRRPAGSLHYNLTKMLDIDLPRITITSDNYGSGATSSKATLTRTRSTSRPNVKQQHAQALSVVGPSVHTLDVRCLLTPSPADFTHSTLYQHTTSSLSRSRSSSFSRSPSPSSPRPLMGSKMAVLSRTAHLTKSPSLDLKPVEKSAAVSFSRTASVDPDLPSEGSTLITSSINKSSSTGSFNKLTLPLPGPTVVTRRHSTKSPGHSPRIMIVTPRSPSPSPVIARPVSASRISSPTSHQSDTKRFCSPVIKGPFVVTRPRSYTTNPAQSPRSDHRRPSERIATSSEGEPSHPPVTTYDRNLKKFYTWCNHCKRVQRAASLTPVTNKGSPAGATSSSKENSQTVRAIRKLSVGIRHNTMRSPRPSLKYSPSFGFAPSDLPLRSPVVQRKKSATPMAGPQRQGSLEVHRKTSTGLAVKERPRSACTPSDSTPIGTDHPHHKSLFDFDNLSAEQVDSIWMYDDEDPLNSDDDFYYDLDVETMSVKSEGSIVICCITCDTKLKDESDDTEPDYSKMPLRKAFSNKS